MANHKSSSSIVELVLLVINVFNKVVGISQVIHREVCRAGKNFIVLIVLAVIFAVVLTSIWFASLTLLYFYLISLHWTLTSALGSLIGLNAFLLLLISLKICDLKRKLLHSAKRSLCLIERK